LKTFTRNFVWVNGYTLFTTDVKTSTNSAKCNVSAGELSIKEALKKETTPTRKRELLLQAVEYLKVGVKIHPKYVGGWIMMGNAYLYLEQWENTIMCYENVLKLAPLHKDAINNFLYTAQNATKQGYHTISVRCYKSLIGFQPNEWDYYYQLAGVYEKQNKIDSVLFTLNYILEKNPKYAPVYSKLGEVYGKILNDLDKSISYLKKANEMDPTDPSALENLGIAFGIKKDWKNSLDYFEKASKLKPDNPQLLMNIAGTYRNMGNKAKSDELTLKAQELSKGTKIQ
jgi:tetratricopeptide (TPR) repeat protein